ncbi:MAG: hypothetical protein AB2A00_27460 [Myxococcota bacterium]
MRIGIFGSQHDTQTQAVASVLKKKGADVVLVDAQGLNRGEPVTFDGERYTWKGQRLDDVHGWYLRHIADPYAPAFEADGQYHLYRDWLVDYMQRRERSAFQLSWLLTLTMQGIPVVNPPEHGSVAQLKALQLAAARKVGLAIPRTLITNDPHAVRQFAKSVGEVVYKPSMGGGLCKPLTDEDLARLELITAAPVTFQERVRGTAVRVTAIGQNLVSCVRIPSEYLDYRADPEYSGGKQVYDLATLPMDIPDKCRALMRECGLLFSGMDFIQRDDGSVVFLEANSSPIYLDVERKTGVPITDELAGYILKLANRPADYQRAVQEAGLVKSFCSYAYPFAPTEFT